MERSLLVGGFGGQGVMMIGTLLAQAAIDSTDKKVTYFPSYGAEQRGGTANCYVVISDDEIGAPVPEKQDALIVMNHPSLVKFVDQLKPGGTLFVNSSIATTPVEREDIHIVEAPVTDMALELGNSKVLNIIMLGIYVGYTQVIEEEAVHAALVNKLGKKKPKLMPLNEAAFQKGLEIGKRERNQKKGE